MIKTLIIGAGPAGLAVAGRMSKLGLPFAIIEQTNKIASAWHNHYDRLCLHTVKQWSHLPHLPFPSDYPTYVPRQKLVEYYEQYATHFGIQPIFNQSVRAIQKQEDESWKIEANDTFIAKNVIVATGINRVPFIPRWKNQDIFEGTITHSRTYKNPSKFKGRTLVVGMGNTGAEVALDLSNHGVETYLSVRSPVNIVPRDLNGRPVQVTSKMLAKIPFGLGDRLGTFIRSRYIGDLSKYGLETSKLHPVEQLKTTGKTPVIDIGTVEAIKAGKIKVISDINYFSSNGVQLTSGETLRLDHVLLATGYRAKVEDFIENGSALLDSYGVPKQVIGDQYHKGLYFVGFDNYKLGGILGTIITDSETIVEDLKKK